MTYQSPAVGHEISCVMHGIKAEHLNNHDALRKKLTSFLEEDSFTILDCIEKVFEPQGYTLAVLLGESHAVIHTYPEHESLYFNMYSCRSPQDSANTYERMLMYLEPREVNVNEQKIKVDDGRSKKQTRRVLEETTHTT